jgi:dTDP-4-amino-4,6-dideoxygalactose transaminase
MIPVTKPYLPSIEKYQHFLEGIYQRAWLTNAGPLYKELTLRLGDYLGVNNLLLVSNGTLALQVALKALKLPEKSKVLTTPFTFVASPAAICCEGHNAQFSDIDPKSLNLAPQPVTQLATKPELIMGVHVFGNPCEVEALDKTGCKVLYDAAHAFGVQYKGQSLLNYGDASTLSFHATKLYHTVEGGAVVFKHADDYEYAKQIINFGLDKFGQGMPEILGFNAKMSEFHAAMGLAMLDDIDYIIAERKALIEQYVAQLKGFVGLQQWSDYSDNNGAYMPVMFESEKQCLSVIAALKKQDVHPRRYFYPSLNISAPYNDGTRCPVSESVACRILCLPLYVGLQEDQVTDICKTIISALG